MNRPFSLNNINLIAYFLGISVLMGLVFAFIAKSSIPDDQTQANFLLVLLQWQLQSVVPMALMIVAQLYLAKRAFFSSLNPWIGIFISGLLGATLFTPIALGIDMVFTEETLANHLVYELIDEWTAVTAPVVLFWLLINSPWILGMDFSQANESPVSEPAPSSQKAFTETSTEPEHANFCRHIHPLQAEQILRMSSELHYVDVVASHQHKLVLYALKEAVAEIPPELGLQVHRSHWVAYKAIKTFEKVGRQGQIILLNGDCIPVSRSLLGEVTEQLARHP